MKKRVIFCTYPSIYSDVVLNELLRADEIDVVGVVLSKRVLNKKYNPVYASLRQIQRSGLNYATYLFVVTEFYSILHKVFRRAAASQCLTGLGMPVLETRDINDAEGQAFIASLNADVMLSAHFNQLVGESVLNIETLSCLNIHPSLLPEYKGIDPVFYALLRQEPSVGVTVHFQEPQFDTGRVLEQQRLEIGVHDSLLSLNLKLFKLGALLAVGQISGLTTETVGSPQEKGGKYDSLPNRSDVKQFRRTRKFFRWKELLESVSIH